MLPRFMILCAILPSLAAAQEPQIDWISIDGGAAVQVSAGAMDASITLGQPDAAFTATGGTLSVSGGFWALFAPPTACLTNADCDDGLSCNGVEECVAGACQGRATSLVAVAPPFGTVDARQPFPPAGGPAQGIGSASEPVIVQLDAPVPADPDCWTVCDTADNTNAVVGAADLGGNQLALTLAHPIAPNAVTVVRHVSTGAAVQYVSHPANTNADETASAGDVLFLIDIFNGIAVPPHGLHSTDVDHSSLFHAADILRTVDLLNGAGALPAQLGTELPALDGFCE